MQMMPSGGYNITDLVREAHIRWLKPGEVLFILQNFEEKQLTQEPVQRPPSGSLFLFNKRVLRFFRKDGHNWRRKKDGRTVGEAHERLKVGNVEALNCYYAHGELNPNFQRRSYWMLDLGMDHIVLVHYRDITMTVHGSGSISSLSTGSDSYSTPLSRSAAGFSQFREPYDSTSSPSSIEVSSDVLTKSNGSITNGSASASSNSEIDQALRRIEAKLSLDDENLKEINTFYNDNHISNDSAFSIDDLDYDDYASQQYPASTLLPHEVEDFRFPARDLADGYPDFSSLFDQGLESNLGLTVPEEQKFMIRDVVPEWGSASEPTKVLIIGSCTCDLSKKKWYCMFGETEVPVEIIQEGVLCCYAPPSLPGKVSLCITSGNRESCSEMREFEYRHKPDKKSRSCEELLLLVRFVQMLLSDQKEGNSRINGSMAGEDSWSQIIEALLDGSLSAHDATDWLVEQLLKDKLHEWLSSKALSKREQGIIHMVSGLGFGWALTPILKSGVGVNFRDINGWTALHWAARFGREKTVAELVAAGAFASAVTDPSHLDPNGKTAASIAATSGHKGLAGYLSEVSLTSHPSLQKQPNQVSRSCADLEAERVANVTNEDLSLKDTLAAVRNATQAAARIQSAFRAHSFRKRKEKESVGYGDEYGILPSEMEVLSKLSFRNGSDHTAALSIQKKYRGWKSRKDFLALRQKVVKIQAHVRGHQVRKNYKVFCWAVGVVEKVVLRWRRKGVGLRGFKQEGDESEDEDEDIVKEFRKEKVDVSIDEAVSRVMSMVDSQPARQQYRRMLQKYCQAKAERESAESEAGSTSEMKMNM